MTTTTGKRTDTPAVELTREMVERELTHALTVAAATGDDEIRNIWLGRAALCRSWLARQDEARDAARMNLLESWAEHPWPINSADMLRLTVVEFGRTLRDVCDAALSKETK